MIKSKRNFLAKVLQYSLAIIPFLVVMLLALETVYTPRSVLLNVLLGGLVCLLVELYIFSKLRWNELEENNFNVVKTGIRLITQSSKSLTVSGETRPLRLLSIATRRSTTYPLSHRVITCSSPRGTSCTPR